MDFSQWLVEQHLLYYISQLFQRFSALVVVTFVLIQYDTFRNALLEMHQKKSAALKVTLLFGALSMLGTSGSLIVDLDHLNRLITTFPRPFLPLENGQILLGFRDTITLMAGLNGGVWIGFGVGLIAGLYRLCFSGNPVIGISSAVATLMLGIFSGLSHRFFPQKIKTVQGVLIVAVLGSIVQRGILFFSDADRTNAIKLAKEIGIPVVLINCIGCVLFYWIINDLFFKQQAREAVLIAEQIKIESEQAELKARAAQFNANFYKQQAELSALHAQVEPHFLNNTLAAIQSLVVSHPENAQAYLAKLAAFFNETRENAALTTITVEQELLQVQRYMEFQQLRFQEKVQIEINVASDILDYSLPPRSLQTLVENALAHGRRGLNHPLSILIKGAETETDVSLSVVDNGCGIEPERLSLLGKQTVLSTSNGTALFQLNQTLALVFSGLAKLSITSQPEQGTAVTVSFPKELN